jgi:localization factor PodJL
MSASAPWSVKGIDPKAREVAKDLARRSGMTLGEWLNTVIIQGEGEPEDDSGAVDLAARRKRALRGSVYGGPERRDDDIVRLTRTVESLSDRIEAVEGRAGGSETTALKLVGLEDRLERADADRRALAARVEALTGRLAETEARYQAQLAALREEAITAVRGLSGVTVSDETRRTVAALIDRVETAERRSARAVERMGQEVLRVAENLHGRMTGLERTGLETARVGREAAEAARAGLEIAEARLRKVEEGQSALLDRLSSDIARMTERLSERLESVERRAALAVDDLGERVSGRQNKLEGRYERLSGEFDARIRASEQRTRLLLDEARETLERALAEARDREAPLAGDREAALAAERAAVSSGPEAEPLTVLDLERDAFLPDAFANAVSDQAPHEEPLPLSERPTFQPVDPDLIFEPAPAAAPPVPDYVTVRRPDDARPEPDADAADDEPRLSTREAVAQARAAARRAAAEAAQAEGFALGSLRLRKRGKLQEAANGRRSQKGAVSKMALASATAVTVVSAVTGWSLIFAGEKSTDEPIAMSLTGPTRTPEQEARLAADYAAAVGLVARNDPAGIAALTRVAEAGYPAAQFHLGKLYETGEGVARNDAEARKWTERAARAGEPRAMHNLGLYWFDGIGGEKDPGEGSVWFRKAARAGVADSQFNLARLYEQGYGVPLNPAAAYEWYLVAARFGDPDAAAAAERIKASVPAEKLARAEQAAAAFQPDGGAGPATAVR